MNKHTAYQLLQQRLESLLNQPYSALKYLVKNPVEERTSFGEEEFLITTRGELNPEIPGQLIVKVSADSPSTHCFERIEEQVLVSRAGTTSPYP